MAIIEVFQMYHFYTSFSFIARKLLMVYYILCNSDPQCMPFQPCDGLFSSDSVWIRTPALQLGLEGSPIDILFVPAL